jgi:hypothetical protein
VEGLTDLTAWCNDVASYVVEAARDDPHNYVTVMATAGALDPGRTAGRVVDRIAERATEIAAAARSLPADLTALGVPARCARQADDIAAVLVRAQGAHLEWLQDSGRYSPAVPVSVEPISGGAISGGLVSAGTTSGGSSPAVPRARGRWTARETPPER